MHSLPPFSLSPSLSLSLSLFLSSLSLSLPLSLSPPYLPLRPLVFVPTVVKLVLMTLMVLTWPIV